MNRKSKESFLPVTPGLVGHYDARVGVKVDSSGKIEQWDDLSGNNNHLIPTPPAFADSEGNVLNSDLMHTAISDLADKINKEEEELFKNVFRQFTGEHFDLSKHKNRCRVVIPPHHSRFDQLEYVYIDKTAVLLINRNRELFDVNTGLPDGGRIKGGFYYKILI